MPDSQHVETRLVCERCRGAMKLFVAARRAVPTPIKCNPGASVGEGGGGEPFVLSCPSCGASCQLSVSEMLGRVNDADRWGRGEHLREGALVLRGSPALRSRVVAGCFRSPRRAGLGLLQAPTRRVRLALPRVWGNSATTNVRRTRRRCCG